MAVVEKEILVYNEGIIISYIKEGCIMTILQVQYFLEIARMGNISRAAEALFVSQPALSLQIKRLEEEIGCELFQREPQGVSLTDAGKVFFREARELAASWNRFQEGVKLLGDVICDHVRIGIGARALSNGLFEAVVSFFERNPETEVTFITDIGDNVLEALAQNRINLALDEMPPEAMISRPERFFSVELLRERQCILLSRDDPRAGCSELPFESLQGSSFISGPEHSLDAELMRMTCEKHGVRMSRVRRADSVEAMMVLIRSGKGVALGPRSFARRYGVAAVPMLPETDAPLSLICMKQNSRNPLVVQTEAYLKEFIQTKWNASEGY